MAIAKFAVSIASSSYLCALVSWLEAIGFFYYAFFFFYFPYPDPIKLTVIIKNEPLYLYEKISKRTFNHSNN